MYEGQSFFVQICNILEALTFLEFSKGSKTVCKKLTSKNINNFFLYLCTFIKYMNSSEIPEALIDCP